MNAPAAAAPAAPPLPAWLVSAFLGLLVLPFHPYWLDFEQVRRGLLLLLGGACLLALPRLRPVRGELFVWALAGGLVGCALLRWLGDAWFRDANTVATFQVWDAAYRIAHWLALLVVLRLGAATRERSGAPLVALLALTAAFGLAQRLGIAEIAGYGVEREPISVFGNLNVAAEAIAVLATAVAVAWRDLPERLRRFALAALGLAGCYLVVNQSRSGLVALPVALALLAVLRRRERPWPPLAAVAAGALCGLIAATAVPRPAPADLRAQKAELQRGTSTIAVRFEIARGTTKLWAESPVFGLGPGQFAANYPRVRSQDEIEASSHGRQFATEVRTAHDDWLELLIDGGVLAIALFAAMLFALQRAQRDKAVLLPLFALLLLMLVRAPLWNAPAAALAFWFAGTPADAVVPPGLRRHATRLLGAVLVLLALPPLLANSFATSYAGAVRRGEQPAIADIESAAACMWFEPRWFEILTREKLAAGDLASAAKFAARALQLRPHHPQLYLNLGEVLARGGKYREAGEVAKTGLARDPANPELRMLQSAALAQAGNAKGAIAAVVEHPHPVLRAQLASHFGELARSCRKDPVVAGQLLIEHHAIAAVDGIGDTSPEALQATTHHVTDLSEAMTTSERRDVRLLMLAALNFVDLGQPRKAMGLGEPAAKMPALLPWQRELFADKLERLRSFESWQWLFAR